MDARSLIDGGIYSGWKALTSGGENTSNLPASTPESPPTSDIIAPFNRFTQDPVRPSTLPGVEQLGSQPKPSTHADGEHLDANTPSAQLSSEGRSREDMAQPPNHGRPVRLPLDEPELHYAPIPIVFELAPDAPSAAATPDRDTPLGGSVPLPTSQETGATTDQANRMVIRYVPFGTVNACHDRSGTYLVHFLFYFFNHHVHFPAYS